MARIISFINQKGGTGKTTICINLGCGLAHFNKRVLIIDMDFQCNATTGLGLEREKINGSTFDLIEKENVHCKDVIRKTYLEKLDIIPASFDLKLINLLAESNPEKNITLSKKIEKISIDYDFILIDNPPSISALTYNSLFASDYVYIPVEMSYFGLEGLDMIENAINLIKTVSIEQVSKFERAVGTGTIPYKKKILSIGGVIINKWDSITKISKEIYSILKERYKEKLFNTKIRINTTIKEAIGEGVGIIDYAPSSHGAEDFIKLTKEVIDRESKR